MHASSCMPHDLSCKGLKKLILQDSMRMRIRGPHGVTAITLDQAASVGDLKAQITANTKLPTFDLKAGYPPQSVDLDQFDDELKLVDTNLKLDGEQLIAVRKDITHVLKKPLGAALAPPITTPQAPESSLNTPSQTIERPADAPTAPLSLKRAPKYVTNDDPPEVPLPELNGTLIMRVMPDDNSCMFRALGAAVMGNSLDSMHELRSMVATQIHAQPRIYTAAVLEKAPNDYCRWIQREDAWGGAIELSILSQEWDIEICSIDVQTLRIDRFNEGKPTRCLLVYSGIHYDVLALSPSEPPYTHTDVPAEFDVKIFDAQDPTVLVAAIELCKILQGKHYYTDTGGFSLKCNICNWKGNGEKGATEHAKKTGHMDFGES